MSEPKRWLEEGAPRDIEHLVRAAQSEHPGDVSLRRTLTALGVGLGATSVTAGAAAAGAAAGANTVTITVGLLAKWTAVGATLGTLTAGAATLARDVPRVAQRVPSSVSPAPARLESNRAAPIFSEPGVTGAWTTASVPVPAIAPPHKPAVTTAPSATGVALDAETLAEEVKSVDGARAALAAGEAARAVSLLDEYERRFAERRFAPEALYLRMEALVSLGLTAQARATAERLLMTYPNSPHRARARAVLSKNP
jgi:hypothetical protein